MISAMTVQMGCITLRSILGQQDQSLGQAVGHFGFFSKKIQTQPCSFQPGCRAQCLAQVLFGPAGSSAAVRHGLEETFMQSAGVDSLLPGPLAADTLLSGLVCPFL